ncbi:MAG: dienelactone hydrolase family protein [Verrucomicrobia bacterium]|nr:dienelactone hydrolase family protein [Verrucomicrobiota bacterium]
MNFFNRIPIVPPFPITIFVIVLSLLAAISAEPKMIVTATNPDPQHLPTLGVWEDAQFSPGRKLTMVSAAFPNVPDFICDSWCYESALEFIGARGLPDGALELRHHVNEQSNVLFITTITPEPGAIEFLVRATNVPPAAASLPANLLTPNLCWQLRRAPGFRSAPDPYPEFVKRCFIFTEKGRTFLDHTARRKIPVRAASDPYNNPPWVQMYVGTWQNVPEATTNSWADYSPDRYMTRVIGAVSRDGQYLAAIANDSATVMAQAWHDCMHNNAQWTPANAPPAQQVWRLKIYAMASDPDELLRRAEKDFDHAQARNMLTGGTAFQTPGIRDRLPVFYERLAERMTFPMSWLSGNFTNFDAWRSAGRAKVMEHLLAAAPPAPFDARNIAEQDRGGYVARKIIFNLTADSRVLALMTVPKGAGPFPAVLLLHDHGAKFDIGKEKVIRPWDEKPEKIESAQKWVEKYYGGRFLGDELAQRGYVCFATDMLNWSDRGGAGFDGQQALAANLLQFGTSFAGLIAHEDLHAAEFLASRAEVDPKRIAAMGLSVGGYRTWQLAALSERIVAGVSVCWMATSKGLLVPGNNQTSGQSAFTMIHPGLANYFDYPDVASLACPKPMMFLCGRRDALFPVKAIEEAFTKMRRVWNSQQAGEKLETRLFDAPHEFNATMQEEAFEWLNKWLLK